MYEERRKAMTKERLLDAIRQIRDELYLHINGSEVDAYYAPALDELERMVKDGKEKAR
jgi:DNA-binding protein Fis